MRNYTYAGITNSNNFKFSITQSTLDVSHFDFHTHDFSELVVILGGTAIHITDIGQYPIAAGDIFVINRNMAHGFANCEGLHLCNIMYDPDQLLNSYLDVNQLPGYHALFVVEPLYRSYHMAHNLLHLSMTQLNRVQAVIDEMLTEHRQQKSGYSSMIQACFMQLVVMLSRLHTTHVDARNESVGCLAQALTLIETQYAEALSLDDLANAAHLSKTHLLRLFNETFEVSPIQYLIRLRIAKACHILHDRTLTITEIAAQVGFEDSNYFTRQFKQIMDVSPSAYRKTSNLQYDMQSY